MSYLNPALPPVPFTEGVNLRWVKVSTTRDCVPGALARCITHITRPCVYGAFFKDSPVSFRCHAHLGFAASTLAGAALDTGFANVLAIDPDDINMTYRMFGIIGFEIAVADSGAAILHTPPRWKKLTSFSQIKGGEQLRFRLDGRLATSVAISVIDGVVTLHSSYISDPDVPPHATLRYMYGYRMAMFIGYSSEDAVSVFARFLITDVEFLSDEAGDNVLRSLSELTDGTYVTFSVLPHYPCVYGRVVRGDREFTILNDIIGGTDLRHGFCFGLQLSSKLLSLGELYASEPRITNLRKTEVRRFIAMSRGKMFEEEATRTRFFSTKEELQRLISATPHPDYWEIFELPQRS